MSNLYSIIPSLTPSANDVMEAELLAKQILEAEFPNLDLREGTGLRDLLLRPTAFAMALLKTASDLYFSQNTLKRVNDTTDTEIVDDILSNWFLDRNLGVNAVISARLYFARAKNVTVPSSVYFSTDGTLKFYPSSTYTFPSTSLSYDSYQNEWYVDVELVAESSGTDYNLGEGSLLYFTTFDPYFLHAEINYLSQTSTDPETNSEFISRAKTAISTRNLINSPSVVSNLQSAFNTLHRIVPVGMGDPDMIRDQIKVVFDPEDARALLSLSQTGGVATAGLPEHGFEVGQPIVITGASPVGYNGEFVVTDKAANTFNFSVGSSLGTVTTLPTVQSRTSPCLVHSGGNADIYCGDEVGSSIVQLTTDASGVATLQGPVYSVKRSDITGGSEDDSIPATAPVAVSASVLDVGAKKISFTTSSAHNLVDGGFVNVTGLTQSKPLITLTCTNLVVTATCTSHGLTTGDYVTVEGVTPVTYNGTFQITVLNANTFTYVLTANVLVNGSGTSMIIKNPLVDGSFAIIHTGTSTFDIHFDKMWSGSTDDISAIALTHSVPFTIYNPYIQTKTLTSLTGTGTTATATLTNHGYAANRYITISGATPSYYNGTWKIREVLSSSQFTFDIHQAILAPATGTISSKYVIPWNDFAYTTEQQWKINFGTGYPSGTASFEIQYFTEVDSVQAYFDAPENHVLCAGYLARGFNLYVLDIDAVVYNSTAPTTGLVQEAANKFLKAMAPGDILVVSDLVTALNTAGVTNLQTPLGISYTYYHRDLITPETGIVVDYLDPLDKTSIFVLGNVTTDSLSV